MDVPMEAVANPGFVFTGWSVDSLGNNASTRINLSEDISITANFEPIGNQQFQSITFSPIADKLNTDNPFQINASASSGLPVNLSVLSGPASILGNTITLNGNIGTVRVLATQNGNVDYLPAPNVIQTFIVTQAPSGNEPIVLLSTSSLNVSNAFSVNISFDQPVSGLTLEEVVVTNGVKSNSSGSGDNYDFLVTPINTGDIIIVVPAGAAINSIGRT